MGSSNKVRKDKQSRRPKEDKKKSEESSAAALGELLPKYRDRAKERREDQNPDYEPTTNAAADFGAFHAVAPPGNIDLLSAEAHKISIENSKYLGGDVEHTHLVKGLDYALLNKVRSEIVKKPDAPQDDDATPIGSKEDRPVSFRTANAKAVYKWIVKPQTAVKQNDMFLPGRMAFIFDMESGFSHDIPTTVHRSKADCPEPEEMVTVSVDGSVLDRIGKIMSYLRLGSSGKILKKKKKDKDVKAKFSAVSVDCDEKPSRPGASKRHTEKEFLPPPPPPKRNEYDAKEREFLPPPPPPPKRNEYDAKEREFLPPPPPPKRNEYDAKEKVVNRVEEDDIFVGEGTDYEVPSKDMSQSPLSEDMEESPRKKERASYFEEPAYGPAVPPAYGPAVPPAYFEEPAYGPAVPPSQPSHDWQQTNGYDAMQMAAAGYQGEWQEYPQYTEQLAYPEQYLLQQSDTQTYDEGSNLEGAMTQEQKDRGLGSVFKRDDVRLQQLREKDVREQDPNFISDSYSECYPGYQEYNREVAGSDDEDDLSKMDMGGRAKGRLHRWDFETEEEWATYNEQKEAMPKAAFQFGVKMQDGRKTRKQNKDQKITNELHKINKILAKKNMPKGEGNDDSDDESHPGKKPRMS